MANVPFFSDEAVAAQFEECWQWIIDGHPVSEEFKDVMPNKNYLKGVRFERERKKYWEDLGSMVLRTAGSHGAFDLVAIDSVGCCYLIQCKCVETEKEAWNLIGKFKANPPLGFDVQPHIYQRIEVKIKGGKVLDGNI